MEADVYWNYFVSNRCKSFINYLLQKDPDNRPTAKEALKHKFISLPNELLTLNLEQELLTNISNFHDANIIKHNHKMSKFIKIHFEL